MSRTFNTLVRLSQIAETAAKCGGRDVNGRQNSLDSEVNRNFPCNTIINCGCQFLKEVGISLETFQGLNTAIIREIPRRHRRRIIFNARARIWPNDKRIDLQQVDLSCSLAKRNHKAIYNTPSRRITSRKGCERKKRLNFFTPLIYVSTRGCASCILLVWHRPSILDRW